MAVAAVVTKMDIDTKEALYRGIELGLVGRLTQMFNVMSSAAAAPDASKNFERGLQQALDAYLTAQKIIAKEVSNAK